MIKPESEANKSEAVTPVGSGTVLAAVERCRDRWANTAHHLEEVAKYNDDSLAQVMRLQAKTIRYCISDLYQEVEAANE